MTPTQVFENLLQLMYEDNGCRFTATEPQRMNGIAAITMLKQNGWEPSGLHPTLADPEHEYEYENDMLVLTQGETEDIKLVVDTWGTPMAVLDKILNDVFENAPA